ncbi:DnaD domain-containing protein [Alicyclobacillus sp. SO9]|uniref:DnaD domain-containing protein n=1 Tax=Alicyclobacillus sp. SO9 TaxID=2665646 RepID=UPI0018E7401E|nr:DnaD domain protein [Alicyclobacillus sp. SO9]QQE76767.1 DnaD domain protein [Alicyclobacillus sp. SO9]
MKPAARQDANADFLSTPFVHIPYQWLLDYSKLQLRPEEFLILMQILGAVQVEQSEFLEPQQLAMRAGLDALAVHNIVERLVQRDFLSIGVRLNDNGTESHYYDFTPLWQRIRGKQSSAPKSEDRTWEINLVNVFEQELGRPLSSLECEQIRVWLEQDGYAEWLIVEALREAIYANKFSIKYIDRVLLDWQRHRILSKPDLEQYRRGMRERSQSQKQTAATQPRRNAAKVNQANQDGRYSNFYKLFPDS